MTTPDARVTEGDRVLQDAFARWAKRWEIGPDAYADLLDLLLPALANARREGEAAGAARERERARLIVDEGFAALQRKVDEIFARARGKDAEG